MFCAICVLHCYTSHVGVMLARPGLAGSDAHGAAVGGSAQGCASDRIHSMSVGGAFRQGGSAAFVVNRTGGPNAPLPTFVLG